MTALRLTVHKESTHLVSRASSMRRRRSACTRPVAPATACLSSEREGSANPFAKRRGGSRSPSGRIQGSSSIPAFSIACLRVLKRESAAFSCRRFPKPCHSQTIAGVSGGRGDARQRTNVSYDERDFARLATILVPEVGKADREVGADLGGPG
jgi:hypothetical protein